jgi:hypothetical protein
VIHWAYASHFGTGRYSLAGGTETSVLSVAPRWVWREPEIEESGRPRPGFEFRLPISVGTHEFPSLDSIGGLTADSVNAVSVVPGVEVEWPMSDRWSLKTLGYLGFGTETGGGVDARIFRLGFRSRLAFDFEDTRMFLVSSLERIGYSADDDSSDAINLLATGLDFSRPLDNTKLGGDPLEIHWHVLYTNYLDTLGLDLSRVNLAPVSIGNEWELGVAFGKQSSPLRFWRLKLDRLGLAYRFGSNHEFEGVSLILRSLFDR